MQPEEPLVIEYDIWRWHTEGAFPQDQPPEHGYVHIGMFVVWLIDHDLLDSEWVSKSGVKRAVTAIGERQGTPCALRDMTDGRLASDMLTPEGQAFAGAYYAPEYGYARDWRRGFGRRADHYAVPDEWETYEWIGPRIERRYEQWVDAGRPGLMPVPGLLGGLLSLWRPKRR